MNSCLYRCDVMHQRLFPKEHRFDYNIFMFYLDLDELDELHKQLIFFSVGRFNWFSFRHRQHLQHPPEQGPNKKDTKQNVLNYLNSAGIELPGGKIMLLTNVATFGYSFNPISFYLCFDKNKQPVCSIAEVCNTHGEMKLYLLDGDTFREHTFRKMVPKLFYVSPFAGLESSFDFIFGIPNDTVHMRVDDYQEGRRFLLTSLSGKRKKLDNMNLLGYGIRFPFLTVKIIFLIHWQAFILYLKRLPFNRKNFNLHLQQDTYPYKKA